MPRPDTRDYLAGIFYPEAARGVGSQDFQEQRALFKRAWQDTHDKQSTTTRSQAYDRQHPSLEWVIRQIARTDSIVEMEFDAPEPTNEPNTYFLKLTLIFGSLETDWGDYNVRIGLSNARLLVETEVFQIISDPTIDQKAGKAHMVRAAGGMDIIGPVSPEGVIDGVLLENESVAKIRAVVDRGGSLVFSLVTTRRGFVLKLTGDEQTTACNSVNKNHVLNALVYSDLVKDRFNRAVLASTRLERKEVVQDDSQE